MVAGPDLSGAAMGTVALDAIVDGARVEAGDPVIGLPSNGLHSNGFTLARRALAELSLDDDRLGRPLGEILLEPTEIYVKPVLELLGSAVDVRGLAHITGDGLNNLNRLRAEVGWQIDDPLPVPPVFDLIAELGGVGADEMYEVFNMGCGFCCVVAAADEAAATGPAAGATTRTRSASAPPRTRRPDRARALRGLAPLRFLTRGFGLFGAQSCAVELVGRLLLALGPRRAGGPARAGPGAARLGDRRRGSRGAGLLVGVEAAAAQRQERRAGERHGRPPTWQDLFA